MDENKKCPYCDSNKIVQTNKNSNTVIGFGAKFLAKSLLGVRIPASSYEAIVGEKYKCLSCQKEWIGGEERKDRFILGRIQNDIQKGKIVTCDFSQILKFFWKIDACIYKISSCEALTGYSYENCIDDYPSQEIRDEFIKIKLDALLEYIGHIISNWRCSETQIVFAACSAGLYEIKNIKRIDEKTETIKCLFEYIKSYMFPAQTNQKQYKNKIDIIKDEGVLTKYHWINIIDSLMISDSSTDNIVISNYLTKDLRLSLWMLNSDQYGSICHKTSHPYSDWNDKKWDSDIPLLRRNFKIGTNENVLFFRDNTFFSEKHNQGVVITDRGIYFIQDNKSQILKIIKWEKLKKCDYSHSNKSFLLQLSDGSKIAIPIAFFTKRSEEFNDRIITEIANRINSVFNDIITLISSNMIIMG